MTIRYVRKNDYRDELELRGFPVDKERYFEMVEIQRKREAEMMKSKERNRSACKQTNLRFK